MNYLAYTWTKEDYTIEELKQFANAYSSKAYQQLLNKDENNLIQQGIPGSALRTKEQIESFISNVDCWTQQGSWQSKKIPLEKLLPHYQDPIYGQCDCQWIKKVKDETIPRPSTQYQWVPSSTCPSLSTPIQPDQWCKIIYGRHTLMVGDLLQYQLHDLFLDALRDGPTICYGELSCRDHSVCKKPKGARLRYLRNDVLSTIQKIDLNNGLPSGQIIEWPFISPRPLNSFKIVIVNRSPILETDKAFIKELTQSFIKIREIQPNALIIYRSSIIGHPYCDEAKTPIHPTRQSINKQHLPFGWSEYQHRNELAKIVTENIGGVYVDMHTSLDLRPDAHLGQHDCSRFCMPGPLDTWALLFYNIFLELGPPPIEEV
ncbi:unnamed protein product [Cunninghamella echinulata]